MNETAVYTTILAEIRITCGYETVCATPKDTLRVHYFSRASDESSKAVTPFTRAMNIKYKYKTRARIYER